ncbi:unnamed protein product, partial [marine sediment metagenome]
FSGGTMENLMEKLNAGEMIKLKDLDELVQLFLTGYRINFCTDGIFIQKIEKS